MPYMGASGMPGLMPDREIARDTHEITSDNLSILCFLRVHMMCMLTPEAKTAWKKLVTPPKTSLVSKIESFFLPSVHLVSK